jgi:uncharacterized protein YdiU (UPF0061 family)
MYYLGIPTTRAATVIKSSNTVKRDPRNNGIQIDEQCAVLLCLSLSFFRFGSFEIFKIDSQNGRMGPSIGLEDTLGFTLLDFTIKKNFPHIWEDNKLDKKGKYLEFYRCIVNETAKMVALWQCSGFVHGVLNTDNMSVLGLTLDFGPFAFMDTYDPHFLSNSSSSDENGRYEFKKQPEICLCNLMKLAEAIQFAVPLEETMPINQNF